MRSLLNALQAGRLIELPDNNKDHALQLLANMIEAIPEIHVGTDVASAVITREQAANTGLGKGWACPHARIPGEGELLCAIGWSPVGIDYGAPDNQPVRMVIMYLVPENQKSVYLKEISSLARMLMKGNGSVESLQLATDLNEVRLRLVDVVTTAMEVGGPDARARMIRIETRTAATPAATTAPSLESAVILPLSVLVAPGNKPMVLTQSWELVSALESVPNLAETLAQQGQLESSGFRVMSRSFTTFQPDRVLYDCLAIKFAPAVVKPEHPTKLI